MSVSASGGGLKMGQVVGSTRSCGEHPKDRPLKVVIYGRLCSRTWVSTTNIRRSWITRVAYPMLPEGKPIAELM
jgi:hypothetical protein